MERLHFGCFNCPLEGWVNTDISPHLFIARTPGLAMALHKLGKMSADRYAEHQRGVFRNTRYLNVSKPWPFDDGRFEAIASSHVVEHLTLHGAKNCFAESRRCLRDGGVLRISVPDLDAYVGNYNPDNALEWATDLFEANERSEKNMHHFMYNFTSMRALLTQAGFTQVNRREYRQGLCPDVDKLDNRPGSLFVEAIK